MAFDRLSTVMLFTARDVGEVLVERSWLVRDWKPDRDGALPAWLKRAADLLAPHAADRAWLTDLLHPIRIALAGRAGEGELDRVILLLDPAAQLSFVVPVKGTRQRMLEFCAALD
jgi:hypothetical protein